MRGKPAGRGGIAVAGRPPSPIQLGFETGDLPTHAVTELRRQNPWWEGRALRPTHPFRRWPFGKLNERLLQPIAPVLVLRGPRQVGKTTLLEQLIEALLNEAGVAPRRIFRVQFDELDWLKRIGPDPVPRLVGWFERRIFEGDLNAAAGRGEPAFVFFDEVQNLESWDVQIKALVDHTAVRVMVTGSSALRIARGRDSLAGRLQMVEMGPLRLAEIAQLRSLGELPAFQRPNGFEAWRDPDFWRALVAHGERHREVRDRAFALFAERGGYPLSHRDEVGWDEIAEQLVETVVNRVIEHDLRIGERGRRRDPMLLREVFKLACRYAGQAPNVSKLADEIRAIHGGNAGPQRIGQYLDFLHQALLVLLVDPLEIRLKRARAPKKLCLSDHALRAATLRERVPLVGAGASAVEAAVLAGRIAESIVGSYLGSLPGVALAWRPERKSSPELDFVATVGDQRIPVEVKYRATIDPERDTAGLRTFLAEVGACGPVGLLVTRSDASVGEDRRIIALPLSTLLLLY